MTELDFTDKTPISPLARYVWFERKSTHYDSHGQTIYMADWY